MISFKHQCPANKNLSSCRYRKRSRSSYDDIPFETKVCSKDTYKIKFNLNRLKSYSILEQFNNISSGKFNSLTDLTDTEMYVNELTNNFNNILYEMATEILGKGMAIKKNLDERKPN